MRRRVLALDDQIAVTGGNNTKTLKSECLGKDHRLKGLGDFSDGAGMVPWRPLQPIQAGFESPALHLLLYNRTGLINQ